MNENKHLTLDERNFIEQELTKNTNFTEIARYLGKDPTTISKEIRKHRIRKEGQAIHVNFNHCAKKFIAIDITYVIPIALKNADTAIIAIKCVLILLMVLVSD